MCTCLVLRGRSATVRADCDLCIAACLACARRVEARVGGGVCVRGRVRVAGGVWQRPGSWEDMGGRLTPDRWEAGTAEALALLIRRWSPGRPGIPVPSLLFPRGRWTCKSRQFTQA